MVLRENNIAELQRKMICGEATSRELTISYIKRIMSVDRQGVSLNSVAELNPDAVGIAEALDRERAAGRLRGLMHGIPVMIKDNISTGDKMHTTAGSVALDDNIAREDAPVVKALRKAGAVLLGKTNMSEFARYMAMEFEDGYSSRGGQVKNPYGDSMSVSGSSSGSAAAVSGDLCAAAVGTETAGSISCPSVNNGICGLKPTVGLVSRSGIIPICGQDTAGPMGRTVEDCAILLNSMICTEDENDPATVALDDMVKEDYTAYLKKDALKGMKIGVNRICSEPALFPEDIGAVFEKELDVFRKAGAELTECDIDFTGLENGILGQATMLYEFKTAINAYMTRYATGRCRTLSDIIEYNKKHHKEALKYGQDLLELAEECSSGRLIETDYWKKKLEALERGQFEIDSRIDKYGLDVIITPGYTNLPPITGYPVMVVPMGFSNNGLPLGMSFYAGAFDEAKIIEAAYGYEQATMHRRPPFVGHDEESII